MKMRNRPAGRSIGLWLLNISCISSLVNCDMHDHLYEKGDKVELWVNKVGPFSNPQEAYDYYTLPYCAPETDLHPDKNEDSLFNKLKTSHHLGEIIGGHTLRHSGHDLVFASADESNILVEECTTQHPLTVQEAQQFSIAAEQSWFYQMYVDDLPIWGMVGEMLPEKVDLQKLSESDEHFKEGVPLVPYVYTERDLVVSYNGNRIVKVDLVSIPMSLQRVKAGETLKFKTFIQWLPTNEQFHSRFERYLDNSFFKHQIHWFSIFNSFMMILFLLGLVTLILLRTLRKDFANYAIIADEGAMDLDEETSLKDKPMSRDPGWKQLHGDVFRAPAYLTIFSAVLGTGWQLLSLTLGIILFALAGPLHGEMHEERGEVVYAVLICYSLSSIVAGYASGSYFKTYFSTISRGQSSTSDSQWQLTMLFTVVLLPTAVVSILSFLNCIAWYKGTVNYIPFFAILKLFTLWIFVSVPLCIVGTLLGRHSKISDQAFPCRINAIPRPIPEEVPWYGIPDRIIPFAGLLSFGSIFIELYYILTSFWNYKVYHVYGFLFGVYFILVLVVSLSTIIVVYFTLSVENYHWQWTALLSGASTSMYVFAYGVYFFLFRTSMFGLTQTCFYFGYTILLSLFVGTLCGTIGYIAADYFVRSIFRNVKLD